VVDAADDNIRYLELRFSPAGKRLSPEAVVSNVIKGVRRASREYAIKVSLLVTVVREFGLAVAEEVLELAIAYREQGVVGLDLAGHEENHAGAPFVDVFQRAQEAGLHATVHAGEVGGAENVCEAIEVLGAERIGHGVRAIEDKNVVQLLRQSGVPLEICLTSNLQTGATVAFSQHPLRDFFHLGVLTTINTDDPSISDTTLTDEYNVAVESMGFSVHEIQRMIVNSARAAFLPCDEKKKLTRRLEASFGP
jgi:adenosine deaminase